MAETHRFSVSVAGAVTDDQGRFLCIKRADNGHWEPPGGVVDPGETLQSALVREVFEETGYEVRPIAVSGVYQNTERDIVSVVFRCQVAAGDARTSHESVTVEWLNREAVQERMDQAFAVRLLDSSQSQARFRAHNGEVVL